MQSKDILRPEQSATTFALLVRNLHARDALLQEGLATRDFVRVLRQQLLSLLDKLPGTLLLGGRGVQELTEHVAKGPQDKLLVAHVRVEAGECAGTGVLLLSQVTAPNCTRPKVLWQDEAVVWGSPPARVGTASVLSGQQEGVADLLAP